MAGQEQTHKARPIIKKIKKIEGGGHGGSWKVAYADFVTAMMAFFLLMWLINMVPQEKKIEVAGYFQDFSLFDNKPPSPANLDSGGMSAPNVMVESLSQKPDGPVSETKPMEKLEKDLEKAIKEGLGGEAKDQVQIDLVEEKVRIEIIDKGGNSLFAAGRATLSERGRQILKILADTIKKQDVKVTIEGHTDAYGFGGDAFTNWELSTERASAARRELEKDGMPATLLKMVGGFAATKPLYPDNPFDARNRRISLLLEKPPQAPAKPEAKADAAAQGEGKPQGKPIEPEVDQSGKKKDILEKQIDKVYDKRSEGQF